MNPDFLKLIVVLAAILYLNFKVSPKISRPNLVLMNIGLSLLLFAALLDFTDGFKSLDYLPILGKKAPFHDFLEDQIGDTPGLALFALGAFRELISKKRI